MMDKAIHKHLDNRLDIQDEAAKMLEEVLASIDLKRAIKDPRKELAGIAHVAMGVAEAHAKDAMDEGIRFAREVREKGSVLLQKSADPNLNEEDAPGD